MSVTRPTGKVILDWGCGGNKHPLAIGMDNVALPTVDVVHSLLETPYPFENASADEIILSHVLEHFTFDQISLILREAHRILKPGGFVTVSVPHALCIAFASDPTHKTRFTFETLFYLTPDHPFAYYADTDAHWEIERYRLWASVNLFNNLLRSTLHWQRRLEQNVSRVAAYAVRYTSSLTALDMLVRYLPIWLVSIHCRLYKVDSR